ncbi:pyridoxal phosphate-dependent decarboxylase family protein [Herbiconiux sp. SYSU D00978]|uniref:pyridoxal phosphate-dependent decarboxylase family protein n=1 Tax=Herbiconiux sp. SYSU D00978 TaxID=2812562 RepID=UPI001A959A75|nr:pyridoxal-dependent decarboxylase [Herbiconiux sp. SYSU D00978]
MAEPGATEAAAVEDALDRAASRARAWLAALEERRVPAAGTPASVAAALGPELPRHGEPPELVIDRLAAAVEPGLMASGSGRFYGWVMGGSLPAALAADWLVSAWDQNAGMRDATPGVVAVEEVAAAWLLEILGLPPESGVGFTTGATTANFTALAAARHAVLSRAGWDDLGEGLAGGPRVRVLAGASRHSSVDLALRYLGLGMPEIVPADDQGRLDAEELDRRVREGGGPTIVCLQAGDIHSGAFDPFAGACKIAHAAGAWVHVDGAFGLWAAAVPDLAHLTNGLASADSWATDAHKTLNVPYDSGIAVVADAAALQRAMSVHAAYLLTSSAVDPYERVPELSRRARGVPVWAAIASLGADGVRELVARLVRSAQELAAGLGGIPGARVLNDVVYTQVSVAFDDDERTRAVFDRILAEGRVMPSASVWHGVAVIRFSVSSWRTGPREVEETVDTVARAAAG